MSKEWRGFGIGSQLLNHLKHFAQEQHYSQIRLGVIDTNPSAKRLYERQKFTPLKTERFEYLRWLLGFGASTTMVHHVGMEKR